MEIRIDRVSKTYETRASGALQALADVTVEPIASGSFVTLVGPSGCGKTTLLDIVMGVTRATSGTVERIGAGADSRPGVVPQQPVLLDWRTSLGNVLLPAELGQVPAYRSSGKKALRARAVELLELVGLADAMDKHPYELSGGMQQRVSIARALLMDNSLICMDEPFSALDEFTREQLNLELLRLWRERGFTGLFVTHNIVESIFLADRILVMTPRPGRVIADVEVGLPRPRSGDMIGSPEFAALMRTVRGALAGGS